jgi:hypothetical protein
MTVAIPDEPKIYHITHIDRLASIIADRYLWCDAEIARRDTPGSVIGMSRIKLRRLEELRLNSHPGLYVGDCVPFYFCPRSVMLYLIYKGNHVDLTYRGGQGPIIHLEADLRKTVAWANAEGKRWAFTLSNAGSYYFEDRKDLSQLGEIDWGAVQAESWRDCRERKQAEFLLEQQFPWELVTRVGVLSRSIYEQVEAALQAASYKPRVAIKPEWYY